MEADDVVYVSEVQTLKRAYQKLSCPDKPFCPLLTGAEGTVIFTGVTVLGSGRTLLLAAFGLCLGAIDVSVGPTESVILHKKRFNE